MPAVTEGAQASEMAGLTLDDAEVAVRAAAAGAAVVRAAYGRDLVRFAKSTLDFATDADIDSEKAILKVLGKACPGDAVLGEETGIHAGIGTRRWLIDPLCGTLNFAARTPLFSVNVTLTDSGRTVAAASADPMTDEIFWTDGLSASVRTMNADLPLQPSAASRLVDINCDGPTDAPFLGGQLVADPRFRAAFGPRVVSTSLAMAWTAAGRRAGYATDGLSFQNNVHAAAGIALGRAAGCIVSDLRGDELGTWRGLVIGADEATHAQLVDLIRHHL